MKTDLDYNTTIPHLSEDPEGTMEVSMTLYSDGPIMSVQQEKQRVRFNKAEIEHLLLIFNRYEKAQAIFAGKEA